MPARGHLLSESRTVKASLIRNLGKVSWFGTLRVTEEDKTQRQLPEREGEKQRPGTRKQGPGNRDQRAGRGNQLLALRLEPGRAGFSLDGFADGEMDLAKS